MKKRNNSPRRGVNVERSKIRVFRDGRTALVKGIFTVPSRPYVLITGGAGFLGTNLAGRLLSQGEDVLIFDNFSRAGIGANWKWLRETHGNRIRLQVGDIRDPSALSKAVQRASHIFHFAAQESVKAGLENPAEDFEINARGTLNLLEAMRSRPGSPPLIFASTSKVYGDLSDMALETRDNRYGPLDAELREHGVGESRPISFQTPYGCSKGSASQYVLDYARTYGIRAAVFRMSCIYGPHQYGDEDQGWVSHILSSTLHGRPITIYGDGKQVRDILFIDDLVEACSLAKEQIDALSGQAFNIGGGPANTISLLELIAFVSELNGKMPTVEYQSWRAVDSRYYASDTRKFQAATGWRPKVSVRAGLERLFEWLQESPPSSRIEVASPIAGAHHNNSTLVAPLPSEPALSGAASSAMELSEQKPLWGESALADQKQSIG
jgi:CDP-paratose 2-epimerase